MELLRAISKQVLARVSCIPFFEQTEEIRLQIVKLILLQVTLLSDESVAMLGDILISAAKLLTDPFPDVKRETAQLILVIT
jgi:hypothetical protein